MAEHGHRAPATATVVRVTFTVFATLFFLYAIYLVRSVLVLIVVAAFLAVGLDPAVRVLDRSRLSRGQSVAVIFIGALLFIGGFFATIIPPLVSQVTSFATNLPSYVEDIADDNPRFKGYVEENDVATRLKEATANVPSLLGSSFSRVAGVAGSILSAFFNGLTVLVLTIYFLLSLSQIRNGTLALVPKSKREQTARLLDPILEKIGAYVAGNIVTSLIAGVVSFIFLTIAGVPFPLALALWVALADLIPLVGATLGMIPAVLVAFFTSTGLGIGTLVFFIVYQQLENYVIAPRVMKKAVDVSAAAVLLSALIGATLMGFLGALMAIPAAAAIKLIVQEVLMPKVERA